MMELATVSDLLGDYTLTMQPIITQAMSSVQTWSDYFVYVIESQFPRDDRRYVVHLGGRALLDSV